MTDHSQPEGSAFQPSARPRRGLPLEEALRRWSDPDAYDAMAELADARTPVSTAPGVAATPKVLRHLAYKAMRDPLEAALLEKLLAAELIASATDERPSPTDPRFVVDPDMFERLGFVFHSPDAMAGIGGAIWNVEVFDPRAIPRNIHWLPDWLEELAGELIGAASPSPVVDHGLVARPITVPFRHDDQYRHVWLHGQEFSLTAKQALVVKALHVAMLEADPWRRADDLLEAADSDSDKLSHLFRRFRDPHWSALIRSDGRGGYRLNVDPER